MTPPHIVTVRLQLNLPDPDRCTVCYIIAVTAQPAVTSLRLQLNLPLRNATMLLRSLKLLFERWPRLVAEYKPTFGSVFEDFISGYSHWGAQLAFALVTRAIRIATSFCSRHTRYSHCN